VADCLRRAGVGDDLASAAAELFRQCERLVFGPESVDGRDGMPARAAALIQALESEQQKGIT